MKAFESRIPPQSILVVDDFLDNPIEENELEKLINIRNAKSDTWYNWVSSAAIPAFSNPVSNIYENAIAYTGIEQDNIAGVECWANDLSIGDHFSMHSDIDEFRYEKTRMMRSALVGLVYFAKCEKLIGGNIIFDNGTFVGAKENRCVIFFGGTPHAIDTVQAGTRKSIVMSLWDDVPLGYQ